MNKRQAKKIVGKAWDVRQISQPPARTIVHRAIGNQLWKWVPMSKANRAGFFEVRHGIVFKGPPQ